MSPEDKVSESKKVRISKQSATKFQRLQTLKVENKHRFFNLQNLNKRAKIPRWEMGRNSLTKQKDQ